ncbi:MFS transporter [Solimonas marina]|uniref:MFS transporter n=1 Tax=Solimonas marina TaxID=2714601 RepID=A0A970B822_9GAMM|nr:MFS transporter [Solimonas marina]NKF24275.1 MFS transporter [Solimonas marina]
MPAAQTSGASSAVTLASVVLKVQRRVMPLFVVMFIVNYIDRVNIGFARQQLESDLGFGAAAYGLGAGLFFIGYALCEVPSNILMQRFGARVWLTRIMLTWGLVASAMVFVHTETQFYVLRFLLGVAEAGFFPGAVLYFTQWFPASARGKAMAIFLSGSAIASILSGPVSGSLMQLSGLGLSGWQWMFLIEGLFSVLLAFVVWRRLDSRPEDAQWLSDDEKQVLKTSLDGEQSARERGAPGHRSGLRLLRDPMIALFCFLYFSISLTIYGATFWMPSIIMKMGNIGSFHVGLLNSVPWIISVVAMYIFASCAARWPNQQAWACSAFVIASIGLFASTSGGPVFAFIAVCFAAVGFKAASSLFWPIPQSYLDSRVAAPAIALINSVGGLGGFVAPTVLGVLEQKTGSIEGGLIVLGAVSLIAGFAVLLTRRHGRGGGGVNKLNCTASPCASR